MCIYNILSQTKPERIYIGSAISFYKRKCEHLSDLRSNKHHSQLLQRHFNKYGENDLIFGIVKEVYDKNNLIAEEQYYIDILNPIFNMCKVAGSTLGFRHTEKTKKQMSEIRMGKKRDDYKMSDKHKMAISMAQTGRKATPETRQKLRDARFKNRHLFIGKKHKTESIEKMRNAKLGKRKSDETKIKMSKARTGKETKWGRMVIDLQTKIIYDKIYKAADNLKMPVSTLRAMLSGRNPNKTSMVYYSV